MTPAQRQAKALQDYENLVNGYAEAGPAEYAVQGTVVNEDLGPSAMASIATDGQYKQHELAALRELENQSQNGFTARDRADMSRVETSVNRANKGRLGAIQQNMQARGMGGSGMEMVAQMQSSQDANEIAALRALEQQGMMQDRKSQATRDLGNMSASLQQREFGQAADKARAQDAIAQFNNANRNNANRLNVGNAQDVANMNVGGANAFGQNALSAQTGLVTTQYNAATEAENRRLLEEEEKRKRKAAQKASTGAAVGGVIGGVAGAYLGGPAGAAAGSQAGASLGGSVASDKKLKKDVAPENDANIEAFLATLEPKSYSYKDEDKPRHGVLAQDLAKSKIGADMLRLDENGHGHIDVNDAVSGLMQAVAYLSKKDKKGSGKK